jgi:hypothetical protein
MPQDIKESAIKKLEEIAMKIKDVRKEIAWRQSHERMLIDEYILFSEVNGLDRDKIGGFQIVETTIPQKTTFKQIDELFNGSNIEKIKNNLVFTIDYDKTYENLLYDIGIQEPLAKGIMKNLEEHSKVKIKKVE